jgi:hypothetical protein
MPFAEDQDAVGEFGSGGQDEAFGEAVRSRASRWDLHGDDPDAGEDGVERGGELAGSVADEEPEGGDTIVEVHQQVAGLLGGPGSSRVAGRPEDVHVPAADFQGEEDVNPFERHPGLPKIMSTRCATSVPSAGETPTGLDQVVLLQPLDGRGCSTRSGCHPATASRSWISLFGTIPQVVQ